MFIWLHKWKHLEDIAIFLNDPKLGCIILLNSTSHATDRLILTLFTISYKKSSLLLLK